MRWLLGFVGLVLLVVVLVGVLYGVDRHARMSALQDGGTVIETAAGPVEYRLEGAGSGPVLVFVHGTPGGYDQGPAARDGERVLTISRPGYLGTPLSSGQTPRQQAELLAALLDELGLERIGIMGASGGGPMAYTFAATYPERTLALVAMEAVAGPMPEDPDAQTLPEWDFFLWLLLSSLYLLQDDEGVVRTIFPEDPDLERIISDREVLEQVAGLIWGVWPPSLRGAGMRNDFDQFAQLDLPFESIEVPTLIIHGTADTSVPFAHGQAAARRISGAVLAPLQGAGHMMPFAHSEEVDRIVGGFLSEVLNHQPSTTSAGT